jgi:lathosterol oxidase
MNLPDFSSFYWFALLMAVFFIIITGRYFLIAGIFYFIFYKWFPSKFEDRKINKKKYQKGQFGKEIKWSIISSLIFSIVAALAVILWQKGYTKVYEKVNLYGWWYLPVSLFIYIILQETYYYWIHRWMHIPAIFKVVHKVHHDSRIASPFTAFSFHPIEGLLQAVFLPVLFLIIPIHYFMIIFLLVIMSISSVVNHLDIDIYPENHNSFLKRYIIGASHHSMHHKYFKCNFGLYFTFWDNIKKTERSFSETRIP